ncbi:MAG TPA: MBL fold metallo-hydrolase [Candidatus Ozemobacteraceae bacterium]|nr:MBL fold metallo-hydrolase [Candidatus Ozemobacteraceae bacterium]
MQIGPFTVDVLSEGTMMLDGGAVFGGLPRTAWESRLPPDPQHRVPLEIRQVLVRRPGVNLLIDTGFGEKVSPQIRSLYGLGKLRSWQERLGPLGLAPEDITHVVFTHLHLEHAGGATRYAESGEELVPMFPRARHYVQESEWKDACVPNERSRAAYRFEDFLPLQHESQVQMVAGDQEIIEGVRVQLTGGHTRGHQIVIVGTREQSLFVTGDLIPTRHHVSPAWLAPGDQSPQDLLESRKSLLRRLLQMPEHVLLTAHDRGTTPVRVSGSLESLQIAEPGQASTPCGVELPLAV